MRIRSREGSYREVLHRDFLTLLNMGMAFGFEKWRTRSNEGLDQEVHNRDCTVYRSEEPSLERSTE